MRLYQWLALGAALAATGVAGLAYQASQSRNAVIAADSPPLPGSMGPRIDAEDDLPLRPPPSVQLGMTLTKTVVMTSFGAYPAYRASDGAVIVALEYVIDNPTQQQVLFDDIPTPALVDDSGLVIQADPALTYRLRMTYTTYSAPPTFVSPGVKLRTVAGFEVAKARFDVRKWRALNGPGDVAPLPEATRHDQ